MYKGNNDTEKYLNDFDQILAKNLDDIPIDDIVLYHKYLNLQEFLTKGRDMLAEAYDNECKRIWPWGDTPIPSKI